MKVEFLYNDQGFRVQKKTYATDGISVEKTTHYVRDASGSTLAIYENNQQVEMPIYGASRLGVYKKPSNTSVYQLTDHLGNVRAVIVKDGSDNAAALVSATDYYPGGMPMPNRQIVGGEPYRYGYQGEFAETDPETGKPAFQLRLYDPRINRWLTTDPYGEFHSPYLAMGNNFPNTIDPDGGCTTCPENAKVGDTFQHSEYGALTYTENGGWGNDTFGSILDDVVITPGIDAVNGISAAVDVYERIHRLERGAWTQDINNLILHRTADGGNVEGTLSWWKDPKNKGAFGTHFLISRNGTIYQTANLNNRTQHTHNSGSHIPFQYRGNVSSRNSVGIEVSGMFYKGTKTWEPPTAAQIEATAYLVRKLKHSYQIAASRVLPHIKVQDNKKVGEGVSILNAINGN